MMCAPLLMDDSMRAALLCLVLLTTSASAGELLIEPIPQGATTETTVAVIKRAFTGRGWTVVESTPTSVTATLSRGDAINARMRISIEGQRLMYDGASSIRTRAGSANAPMRYTQALSPLWVGNLRHDIGLSLASMPGA